MGWGRKEGRKWSPFVSNEDQQKNRSRASGKWQKTWEGKEQNERQNELLETCIFCISHLSFLDYLKCIVGDYDQLGNKHLPKHSTRKEPYKRLEDNYN